MIARHRVERTAKTRFEMKSVGVVKSEAKPTNEATLNFDADVFRDQRARNDEE
jgi:hypothetical protein